MTAPWVCLGSGVGLFIGGTAIGMNAFSEGDGTRVGTGAGMTVVGTAAALASIPLFIVLFSVSQK